MSSEHYVGSFTTNYVQQGVRKSNPQASIHSESPLIIQLEQQAPQMNREISEHHISDLVLNSLVTNREIFNIMSHPEDALLSVRASSGRH